MKFNESTWKIVDTGFFLDRKWIIINYEGDRVMTLKRYPKMAKITPIFIKDEYKILLKFENFDEFRLKIPNSIIDECFSREIEVNLLNTKY